MWRTYEENILVEHQRWLLQSDRMYVEVRRAPARVQVGHVKELIEEKLQKSNAAKAISR